MRRSRGLTREDAELWNRVARTVKPIAGRVESPPLREAAEPPKADGAAMPRRAKPPMRPAADTPPPPKAQDLLRPPVRPLDRNGLDGSWEKKLARAEVHPDFTLDLHGHGLDAAWSRLEHGLAQASAMGARVVLVITGKPRPVEAADRGERRGAIRAKLLDWLAHGSHAGRIASVRGAHRKHGGAGAVYVILKKAR
ncbi:MULTISPECIES: Smr/MutS family protein [unclassified Novosphingobium]|uniref:Smr/MutS family protein n=1 Tax=unclassified Novosphingobium TaxID=2644732 RepID=UPI000EE9582D|nr:MULTISPECIES: Smr/MutS family protein [unclassified Novosphingobium]HCF24185.1 DNA mismatch repair protein MutS [Novosphingobium sp.]HQV02122.1 Smr/MutS family protein [Novosphingobium sp.]